MNITDILINSRNPEKSNKALYQTSQSTEVKVVEKQPFLSQHRPHRQPFLQRIFLQDPFCSNFLCFSFVSLSYFIFIHLISLFLLLSLLLSLFPLSLICFIFFWKFSGTIKRGKNHLSFIMQQPTWVKPTTSPPLSSPLKSFFWLYHFRTWRVTMVTVFQPFPLKIIHPAPRESPAK